MSRPPPGQVEKAVGPPIRLQLSRAKGFDLQAVSIYANGRTALSCARPHRWGNHFKIIADDDRRFYISRDSHFTRENAEAVADTLEEARQVATDLHRAWLNSGMCELVHRAARRELRGLNLACFCSLDGPCHVDALLEVANDHK